MLSCGHTCRQCTAAQYAEASSNHIQPTQLACPRHPPCCWPETLLVLWPFAPGALLNILAGTDSERQERPSGDLQFALCNLWHFCSVFAGATGVDQTVPELPCWQGSGKTADSYAFRSDRLESQASQPTTHKVESGSADLKYGSSRDLRLARSTRNFDSSQPGMDGTEVLQLAVTT